MKRKIMCALALLIFSTENVFASVLGTQSGGWSTDMGGGAVYNNSVYGTGSNQQTENYVEYTPNDEARPVVVNGESVYGTRTITSASEYMKKNNLRPLVGINGDFFSTKTGIPMGYTIIDGRIWSKESTSQDAIGFNSDGSAFIDKMQIETRLYHKDKEISVQYINKWLQKGFTWVNLLDSNFGETTRTDFNALYVIASRITGELAIDESMELKVDEVFIYDGSIKIPEGKYVFVMNAEGDTNAFDLLANLAVGDTLTLENRNLTGNGKWKDVSYAISTVGDRLIENGAVMDGFEGGRAPRTAVGIKSDGKIVFYTIDGRQSGYSRGATIEEVAKRMAELGCYDAINLDGGGSTAIGGIFPGTESFVISNKPSDKTQRRCANYLFLQDLREKTGVVWHINWRDNTTYNFLSGVDYKLDYISVYDTGNYKMEGLRDITFSLTNHGDANASMEDDRTIHFDGNGKVTVDVAGPRYNKTFTYEVFDTPEEVVIYNEATGKPVEELTVLEDGMINYALEAKAFVNGVELHSTPNMFVWGSTGNMAEVDSDGNVAIAHNGDSRASIKVTVNGATKEIPIRVIPRPAFSDTKGHWADETIKLLANREIINGFEENGVMVFKPDSNITRAQFCTIVAKSLGISGDSTSTQFMDNDAIAPWALPYVNAMVDAGYITGKSDDGVNLYFDPENSITRCEAFVIISRIIGENSSGEVEFADSDEIHDWAVNGVMTLVENGIVNGYEDNTIRPNNTITRAEAATLVLRSKIII